MAKSTVWQEVSSFNRGMGQPQLSSSREGETECRLIPQFMTVQTSPEGDILLSANVSIVALDHTVFR